MAALAKTTNSYKNNPLSGTTVVLFDDLSRVTLRHNGYSSPVIPVDAGFTAADLRSVREVSISELTLMARGLSAAEASQQVKAEAEQARAARAAREAQQAAEQAQVEAAAEAAASRPALATDRQVAYLRDLGVTLTSVQAASLTKGDASRMIDNVKAQRAQGFGSGEVSPWSIVD